MVLSYSILQGAIRLCVIGYILLVQDLTLWLRLVLGHTLTGQVVAEEDEWVEGER